MGDDVNAPLPAWADNAPCRALIAAIIEEQPEAEHPVCANWGHSVLTYRGQFAPKLRRYHKDLLEAAIARSTAEFIALSEQEKPDALIARVLAEISEVEVKPLGDGWHRAEAA